MQIGRLHAFAMVTTAALSGCAQADERSAASLFVALRYGELKAPDHRGSNGPAARCTGAVQIGKRNAGLAEREQPIAYAQARALQVASTGPALSIQGSLGARPVFSPGVRQANSHAAPGLLFITARRKKLKLILVLDDPVARRLS